MSDEHHMSGMEAMMWGVESDPWLDPNGGSVTIYDRPLDPERFRRGLAVAVAEVPRMRERVARGLGRLSMPRWVPDHEFDLDWHVRRIGAPGNGTLRELLDYFTAWLQDPYDRSRPLWTYILVDGLENGRGALLTKIHHTVGDGDTLVRMMRAYTDTERDAPPPREVDLDALIAASPVADTGIVSTTRDAIGQGVRWQTDLAKRALNAVTRPARLGSASADAADLLRTVDDQLHPAGSELWRARSRRRRVEALSIPFEPVREAAHALGGTINDFFLTGAIEGACRYHDHFGDRPERLHITFVVSTRSTGDTQANAFTPVPVDLPGGTVGLAERFASVHELVGSRRDEVHGGGPMASLSSVANLLPLQVLTTLARDQASHIDFATSNLPGFLGDSYVAGAKTLHAYPFGPVAGTAFNLTMMSTAEWLDLGINIDPAAVTDPALLAVSLQDAYDDLLAMV